MTAYILLKTDRFAKNVPMNKSSTRDCHAEQNADVILDAVMCDDSSLSSCTHYTHTHVPLHCDGSIAG